MKHIQQLVDLFLAVISMDAEPDPLGTRSHSRTAHRPRVDVMCQQVALQPVHKIVAPQHKAVNGALAFDTILDMCRLRIKIRDVALQLILLFGLDEQLVGVFDGVNTIVR